MNFKVSTLNIMTILNLISSLKTTLTLSEDLLHADKNNLNDINLIGQRKFLNDLLTDKTQKTGTRDFTKIVGRKLLSFEDNMTSNVSNATTKKAIRVTTKINDTKTKNIKRASEYTSEQTTFINALPFFRIENKALSMDEQKLTTSIDNVKHRSRYDKRGQDHNRSIIDSTEDFSEPTNDTKGYQSEVTIPRNKNEQKDTTTAKRLKSEDGDGEIYTSVTYLTYKTDDFRQRNFTTRSFVVENSTISSFHESLIQDEDKAKSVKNKTYNRDFRMVGTTSIRPKLELFTDFSVASMVIRNKTKSIAHNKNNDSQHLDDKDPSINEELNETLYNILANVTNETRHIKDELKVNSNNATSKMSYSTKVTPGQSVEYNTGSTVMRRNFNTVTSNLQTFEKNHGSNASLNPVDQKNMWKLVFRDNWSVDLRYFDKHYQACQYLYSN